MCSNDELSSTMSTVLPDKVYSTQEACPKCFAVDILTFENLANLMKKCNKQYKTLIFQYFFNKSSILMFFFNVFSCGLQGYKM